MLLQKTQGDLEKLRSVGPLVHNITNYVVMNNTANALLAIGASPIMAHAIEEVEEMVSISQCLVINIGTLSASWLEAMTRASAKAKELDKPIVLDPVGAGASQFRIQAIRKILEKGPPSIIRGNASEIISTAQDSAGGKGVDATDSSQAAITQAKLLSERYGSVVVVSGEVDYVVFGKEHHSIHQGHPLMTKVTGMGCTATAICGAFAAIQPNFAQAAFSAMAVMGIAGEMAAEEAKGPGTFQSVFLDKLFHLTSSEIQDRWKSN